MYIISNNALVVFLVTFLAAVFITSLLIHISKKTGFLVDVPKGDALKIHTKHIPLLGGLAMLLAALAGAGIFLMQGYGLQTIGIFTGLLIIFFLGFWDDLKWKHISTIKPFLKFTLLIFCTFIPAVILALIGIRFDFLPVTAVSIILGFGYIFVVVNALNYQDGMDGLAGGLSGLSLAGFLWLGFLQGNMIAIMISLLFLAAVLAFLWFNFPPAKVFMGDSGAYSLGFILTVLAILLSKPYSIYSVIGPVVIIGLPIFDGIFTNIRRLVAGKSIFLGDRSHVYDKLLQKGYSTKKTLAICYFLQVIFVVAGIIIYQQ